MNQPERILVRGVNWLGDAVMSTPALLRLRESRPGAHISLLTHEKLRDIWQVHPALDQVLTFASGDSPWRVGRRLRQERFDLGLVFPNSPRSALELWLAGIPERAGYAARWRRWFLTRPIAPRAEAMPMHKRSPDEINCLISQASPPLPRVPSDRAHHIFQYLHLTAALGASAVPLAPRLEITEEAVARFAQKMLPAGALAPLWFGLNAGAEYGPAKRWPMDRFTEAAIQIQRQTNCRWLVFGLKNESAVASRIADAIQHAAESHFGAQDPAIPRALSLAGRTTLGELCAALKICRALLTNDSGPMHVAAALGTPVIVPFGSTSPELTGPGLPGDIRHRCLRANVPCSPCFLRECPIDFRCMTGISVEKVVAAFLDAAGTGQFSQPQRGET